MSRVYIFDTTLRDGEQSPGCSMTTPEKMRMAAHLVDLGVDILEAGFPIASEGDFESVQAISRQYPWVQVAALARATKLDIERAAESLKDAKRPRIHTFLATSDIHLKYKLKKSREQVLEEAAAAVALARSYVDDVEFSAEDATRTDPDFLERVSNAVVAAGARTVNLPDTVGFSVPDEYGELIGRIAKVLGDRAIVSVHCHDDLGLAAANSLAAVKAGARQVECTINGIGERAGNASLEEVVMAIKTRNDRLSVSDRNPYRKAVPRQSVAFEHHCVWAPTEQGDCWRKRLCARGRHPPGRLPQREKHLRNYRSSKRGGSGRAAGAGQAQWPSRLEETYGGPGIRPQQRRTGYRLPPVHFAGRQEKGCAE